MSFSRVTTVVAAAGATLALSAVAYGDVGKSPNGPPGPAGNPNQPAAQAEAAAPQAGQGNSANSNGKSGSAPGHNKTTSQGTSDAAHGKRAAAHNKTKSQGRSGSHSAAPKKNQANPNPGTPRKGGRADRPADKITICHATKSVKNPYVEITISLNGLHGHGPADDSRHHEGSWQDIIPAPKEGGCPPTVQETPGTTTQQKPTTAPTVETPQNQAIASARPEVAAVAPDAQGVLGVQAAGGSAGSAPAGDDAASSGVLGEEASGSAPASAVAARETGDAKLPFTGFQLAFVLVAAAAALLGGFALRRAAGSRSS